MLTFDTTLPNDNNNQPILLNLGCGTDIRDGFINIDLFSDNPNVVKMDIRKLDFKDNSVDFILASDILEHFSHRQIATVLKEWARVLKPNAQMIIRCPSLRLQAKAYYEGKWDADIASYMIFGGQTNPGDYHCIGFDENSIKKHLTKAGLQVISFEEIDTPQDKGFINLNMTVKVVKIAEETLSFREKNEAIPENQQELQSSARNIGYNTQNTGYNTGKTVETPHLMGGIPPHREEYHPQKVEYHPKLEEYHLTERNTTQNRWNTTSQGEIPPEKGEIPPHREKYHPKQENKKHLNIVWEGSQFVYHSLALINREQCKNIIDAGVANLTIVPYEPDDEQFIKDNDIIHPPTPLKRGELERVSSLRGELEKESPFKEESDPATNQFPPFKGGKGGVHQLYNNDIRYKQDVSDDIANLPYVWIRHQWPPKAERPQGAKWIIMQPWEYSKFPQKFIDIFEQCDEIWTPSTFSRQAFLNSGIDFDKVQVMPNGINPQLFKPVGTVISDKRLVINGGDSVKGVCHTPLQGPIVGAYGIRPNNTTDTNHLSLNTNHYKKPFRFLYVGGTTYRKGFDILLQAYLRTFTNEHDVCLVVKDMGTDTFYKGQTAEDMIMKAKANPHCPAIEYIKDNLTEEEMAALYRSCDVFVSPYRGEGFSLPTLEAMASGLPVIVTRGGSTDDFTTDECAWYINSTLTVISDKSLEINGGNNDTNHLSLNTNHCNDIYLLEPSLDELIQTLEYVYKEPTMNFSQGIIGSYLARKHWTWKRSTMKILNRLDYLYGTEMAKDAFTKLQEEADELMQIGEAELEYQQATVGSRSDIANKNNLEFAERLFIIALESDLLEDRYLVHCFNRLAQISISKNKYIDAYKYTETAKAIDANNPDTVWLIAAILCVEENYIEALETVTVAVDNWREWKYRSTCGISLEKHLLLMADILRYMGDLEKAAQIYEAALKVNNYSAEACYGLAMTFKEGELYDSAKEMFDWAIRYEPNFTKAIEELANLPQ